MAFVMMLGVIYFGLIRPGGKEEVVIIEDTEINALLETIKEIRLNTEVLNDKRFLDLSSYEKLSTEIETGRSNPFLPY